MDCILGTCLNKCKLVDEIKSMKDQDGTVCYYQFEKIASTYYNKDGDDVSYQRTACVNKEGTLFDIYLLLQDIAQKYVLHRYFVLSDNIFWTKFKSLYANLILTIDNSENINLVPKHEVQSTNFSGCRHRSIVS